MSRSTRWELLGLFLVSVLLIAAVIVIASPKHAAKPDATAQIAQPAPTAVAATPVPGSEHPNLLTAVAETTTGQPTPNATVAAPTPAAIGKRTKTSGCVARGSLPDPACTPGEVLTTDAKTVCASGYAGATRDVSSSTKAKAYSEYGIASHTTGEYEVDHLVSLELGGSNGIANLWPEAANANPGYHQKDQVENYLHAAVCSGAMTLPQAQAEIANNWVAVYDSMGP